MERKINGTEKTSSQRPTIDEATGILNRSETLNRIEHFLQSDGKDGVHGLILLDLDDLKAVNDTVGREGGDGVIRRSAERMASFFRRTDIVGRVGGDEFFAFVKNIDEKDIASKTAALLLRLQTVLTGEKRLLPVTASAGIAMYYGNGLQGKTLRALYAEADVALNQAKAAGKNTFSFANASLMGRTSGSYASAGGIGYGDGSKRNTLIPRKEMIGFLDKRYRANNDKSASEKRKRDTILIADDVEINREMFRLMFEGNYRILEAGDGEEAISLIDKQQDRLALIFLDHRMPKKTGLDVLVHLDVLSLCGRIPIVMVTGAVTEEMSLLSSEFGISDIIQKPFDSRIVRLRAENLIALYTRKEEAEAALARLQKETEILREKLKGQGESAE